MIRTYIFNKNDLEQVHYTEDLFSAQRREKMGKMKREDAKIMSACAELLLIYALKQQDPEIALPLPVVIDERQKPQLPESPWYFNLSHAGDYAACAVSDAPIGVDIEYFRVRELMSPDRILHPDEAHLLAYISNPNEKKKYFYECWVSKESYLKNLGIGLIVRPRDFAVSEDHLKIGNEEVSALRGHHSAKMTRAEESAAASGTGDTAGKDHTLQENLSYLKQRYVHVMEPGEVRGTDWKFDAGYRIAVCSMQKDPDSIARRVTADMINQILPSC